MSKVIIVKNTLFNLMYYCMAIYGEKKDLAAMPKGLFSHMFQLLEVVHYTEVIF